MDGSELRTVRERRGETGDAFAKSVNEKLGRRHDRQRVSRWENGTEVIPADVEGLITLWQLAFRPTGKCKTVTICQQKGGIGKSTTCTGLAHILAVAGARVLIVDCDSQANATMLTGLTERNIERLDREQRTLYHVLAPDSPLSMKDAIRNTSIVGLDVVPSSISLAGAEMTLNDGTDASKRRLRELIGSVKKDYDFILVDTAPSLGILTISALTAANAILIPVQCESLAISGLKHLHRTISGVRDRLNPDVDILGILPTMYTSRLSQDRESLDQIHRLAGDTPVFEPIPKSTIYTQAAAGNRITHDADPSAPGLMTYISIAKRLGVTHG